MALNQSTSQLLQEHNETQFIFERAPENWHYILWLGLAIFLIVIALRRYGPKAPTAWGHIACACRVSALLLIVLMLAGPAWRTVTHHTQPGAVTIVIDQSSSMQREDLDNNKARITRSSDLYHAIQNLKNPPNNTYLYKGICARGEAIDQSQLQSGLVPADGTRSKLSQELRHLLSSVQSDAFVFISDGRSTHGGASNGNENALDTAAAAFQERGIPVMILATGSDVVESELSIQEIIGNRTIAKSERQPFTLRLNSRQLLGEALHLEVRNQNGDILNSKDFTLSADGGSSSGGNIKTAMIASECTIDISIHIEGEHTLTFKLSAPSQNLHSELSLDVRATERKLHVLMLAHHPRYEMRYLRNALDRDHTVNIHSYIADGRWRRWGGDRYGPETLPLQSKELKKYDAIILGDVSSNALSIPVQENIVRAVRQHGLGLIWIPGERGAIADFRSSPLGKIIPAQIPDRDSVQRGYLKGVIHDARSTDIGDRILNAGDLEWHELPSLIGSCPIIDQPVKGAQVLLTGHDDVPLIISRPYGTGHSTLILVDDTWRWRKQVGDFYLHRFYSSLLRHASSGRQLHRKPWRIITTPSRVRIGDIVSISVAPTGPISASALLPDSITLAMTNEDSEKIIRLHRAPDDVSYGITTSILRAGAWKINIADGLPADDLRSSELTVLASSAENSDPRIDLASLESLARATGGSVFSDPEKLAAAIRDHQHRRSSQRIEAAWDSMWFLIIIISFFCIEWAIRRHFRLP